MKKRIERPIAAAPSTSSGKPTWTLRLAAALGVLILGAGVGWAGALVLTPPADVLDSTAFTFVEVVNGEVGSNLTLNTVAEWAPIPAGSNLASGTVTTVDVGAGQEVGPGSILYTVNLRPVVVAQGEIPSFRSLASSASGADVVQLQEMLASLGYFSATADGFYGRSTSTAVKAWQKGLGLVATGVVEVGDVVFLPTLPARISLDVKIVKRGAVLSGGENVIYSLPPSPAFSIPVSDSQAALMPVGTRVEISTLDGGTWEAFVAGSDTDDQGAISMTLEGASGASICADQCSSVPVSGATLLLSRIVTVETMTGPTVPSAALLSGAGGDLWVIDAEGNRHEVTVLTSARGMSIVDGVTTGLRVRVPAVEE